MIDDSQPIYLQVAAQIEEQILSGDLAPGDQVMSTTDWATFLRINPATAAKGINMLVADGLLHKRRGVGMFVSDGARTTLRHRRHDAFFVDHVDPLATEASLLGISIDDVVARLRATAGAATNGATHNPESTASTTSVTESE